MPFLEELCRSLKRLFKGNTCSCDTTTPPAPQYTTSQTAILQRVPEYTATDEPIKAADTPQWAWTNAECKEWLFAVCYESLGFSGEEAKAVSEKFDGFGPVIYCMDQKDWKNLLGTTHRANGVYATLYNVMREPGAVPLNLVIKHPREKKKRGLFSHLRGV